ITCPTTKTRWRVRTSACRNGRNCRRKSTKRWSSSIIRVKKRYAASGKEIRRPVWVGGLLFSPASGQTSSSRTPIRRIGPSAGSRRFRIRFQEGSPRRGKRRYRFRKGDSVPDGFDPCLVAVNEQPFVFPVYAIQFEDRIRVVIHPEVDVGKTGHRHSPTGRGPLPPPVPSSQIPGDQGGEKPFRQGTHAFAKRFGHVGKHGLRCKTVPDDDKVLPRQMSPHMIILRPGVNGDRSVAIDDGQLPQLPARIPKKRSEE